MDLRERIKNGWEISAEGYSKKLVQNDFISPGREIWTELILSKAPKAGQMKILDVGTGPGVFATILTLAGHNVTGIDVSPKMLDEARENSKKYGVSPEYIIMDSHDPKFSENTFDMIVSRNVVWLLEDPLAAYENWFKILRPGGRIIVFDSGHGKDGFLTKLDTNPEQYIKEFRQKHGTDPEFSFDPKQYETARGWKKELKLTYEKRPDWDVESLKRTGYANIHWDDVTDIISYPENKHDKGINMFFRLCADKPL